MTVTRSMVGAPAGEVDVVPSRSAGHHDDVPLASTYYRAIDGLRGVAVLSVVVYHTGLYEAGLFGVDVFMVLSGFLITLTLLRERSRRGRVGLGAFYRRRAKRLIVPLLIVLGASALAVAQLGRATDADVFARQGLASLLYVANWEQILRGDAYWDATGGVPGPLAHMWSLSITEQFYLVWPPLLVLILLLVPARRRVPVVVGTLAGALAVVTGFATALLYDGTNADALYLGTHTHGSALAVGAVVAALVADGARRAAGVRTRRRRIPSWCGGLLSAVLLTALVVVSVLTPSYREPWLYASGGLTVVALLVGLLVLSLTREDTVVARALGAAPLVGIGKFSYSLYLVHVPVLWALSKSLPDPRPIVLLIVGLPLSIVLAAFLHHIIGEPARLRRWSRAGVTVFTALAVVVVGGVAVVPRLVDSTQGEGARRVLVVGDSLGHDVADALVLYAPGQFTVTDAAFDGCGIFGQDTSRSAESDVDQDPGAGCNPWEPRWAAAVDEHDPDVVVVTLGWDATRMQLDGRWMDACSAEYAAHYDRQLEAAHEVLTSGRDGRQVLFTSSRRHTNVVTPAWAECHTAQLRAFAEDHADVHVLELDEQVCRDDACIQETPEGDAVYLDTVHFTRAGMAWIAPWVAAEIDAVTAEQGDGDA